MLFFERRGTKVHVRYKPRRKGDERRPMENESTPMDTLPPEPQATETPAQEQETALQKLEEREKALKKRELLFRLRETLREKDLPQELADLIDVSDEQRMQQALQKAETLVRSLRRGVNAAPPIGTPPENMDGMGYRERAEMYLNNNARYIKGGL